VSNNQIQKANGGALTAAGDAELKTKVEDFMTRHSGALSKLNITGAALLEVPEAATILLQETDAFFAEQTTAITGARAIAKQIWDFEQAVTVAPTPTSDAPSPTRQKSLEFLMAQRTVAYAANGGGK
jgi:hypothetical protein